MRGLVRAGAVAVAAALLAACVTETSIEVPDAPVVTEEPVPAPVEPGADGGPPADEAELVTPRPGMVDVRAVPWDEATVDGTTVTVRWWSGVEPCNVLDRVEVDEGDEVVTITLYEGSDPAEPDAACIELAVRKATEVELSEPVGQRSLVDGADEGPAADATS